MALPSRRTFNNFLILGVLLFIALINLPTYLRSYISELDDKKAQTSNAQVIALFPQGSKVNTLEFPDMVLKEGDPWQTNRPLSVSASELANRWLHLSGTPVDTQMYQKLKESLPEASTLRVKFKETEQKKKEPLDLIYYQFPSFWLIQNHENHWLAVSVDAQYLFPFPQKEKNTPK